MLRNGTENGKSLAEIRFRKGGGPWNRPEVQDLGEIVGSRALSLETPIRNLIADTDSPNLR